MIARAAGLAALLAAASVAYAEATLPTAASAPAPPPAAAPAPAAPAPAVTAPAAPDPAVEDAAEANLESIENRSGLTFAASIGGGLVIGFGIKDSVGRGGALSLRLGHVATRRTVITFELGTTAVLHKPAMTSETKTNTNTNLLAGALYYVNPSLWLRFGGGLGVYQGRQVTLSTGQLGDVTLSGLAMLGGVGVDLARFKSVVLDLEIATSAMINSDGILVASGANLGLSFD
jgi:hypothetical protein